MPVTMLKRLAAIVIGVFASFLLLGAVIDSDPPGKKAALILFALAILAACVALWRSAQKTVAKNRERAEVQKLLAMVGDQGTLATPQLVAAGYTREEAEEALKRLQDSGVAQFDVDETGTPVYRVHQAALEARKRKTW